MGAKTNRTCIICKNQYHYCPNCGADAGKPTWYFIFDGQNCHDIYEVCTQYRDKEIDAETAYQLISKLDLSKIENFAESTRLQIEEIKKLHDETVVIKDVVVEKTETMTEKETVKNNTNFTNNTNKYYKKK